MTRQAETKPYPVTRCAPEEAKRNYDLHVQRQAIDRALQLTVEAAIARHAAVGAAITTVSAKLWAELSKKYSLDPAKIYGTQLIDGKPYIVESTTPGAHRP